MNLMKFLRTKYDPGFERHESSGRFIPINKISTAMELENLLVDVIPMLHIPPDNASAVKYCFSELIRNVLEHAGEFVPAYVCAQYYKRSNKIQIGIADCGQGILSSLERKILNLNNDHAIAITEAMKPGVSGGSSSENAGAGLYFIKSIAKSSGTLFSLYSGSACYKLLGKRKNDKIEFVSDPLLERHNLYKNLPFWQGTVIAVEIGLDEAPEFNEILKSIRKTFFAGRIKKKRKRRIKFT
jgi:anti-sigma regulatory factor (Ser/Thr protein kinase)